MSKRNRTDSPPEVHQPEMREVASRIEAVPIDSVTQDPRNARTHSDANLAAIKASLARFGQVTPIVVGPTGVILKGNGTHRAAAELGFTSIKVLRVDLDSAEAMAYAVADNRSGERAGWDDLVLAETLKALQSEEDPGLFEATGFDGTELHDLLEKLAAEAAKGPEPKAPEPEPKAGPREIECPNCGHLIGRVAKARKGRRKAK